MQECPVVALQHYMGLRRLSQVQMAQALGMNKSHLNEVLQGRRALPLRAIRSAVKLGMSARVMILPTPYEREKECHG